jgi:predicted N-acyltransferase
MADREPDIIARLATGFGQVDPGEWDRLAGDGDPVLAHRFFALLERSGSIGGNSGWSPLPLVVERGGAAVAAAPAFLKAHSQGEYVFDHGWAEAWNRAGGDYYPKLQVAVPFTPCPGRRLLGTEPDAALAALETLVRQNRLSSGHVTFCTEQEAIMAELRGWLVRHGIQFHWINRGYADFDDFLATLSSRKRKAIRKERAAANHGVEIVALRGAEITPAHWDSMWEFYQDTGSRKWGEPYLTRGFFREAGAALGSDWLMFLAFRDGRPVAGALNLVGADTLYGRYWGASEERPFLHFELSYYRAIDWAIANRLGTVQAGAQGEHKLARGYQPVRTFSVHDIPDPGFKRAVAEFLERERDSVAREIEWASAALPYRSSE